MGAGVPVPGLAVAFPRSLAPVQPREKELGWRPPCSHGPFPAPEQGWSLDPPLAVPNDGAARASLFRSGVEVCLLAWERPGKACSRGLGSAQNRGFQSLDMRTESCGLPIITPVPLTLKLGPSKATEVGKGPVSFPTAPQRALDNGMEEGDAQADRRDSPTLPTGGRINAMWSTEWTSLGC